MYQPVAASVPPKGVLVSVLNTVISQFPMLRRPTVLFQSCGEYGGDHVIIRVMGWWCSYGRGVFPLPSLAMPGGIKNHVVSKLLIHLTSLRFELASSPLWPGLVSRWCQLSHYGPKRVVKHAESTYLLPGEDPLMSVVTCWRHCHSGWRLKRPHQECCWITLTHIPLPFTL